jgi:hypothetical protein
MPARACAGTHMNECARSSSTWRSRSRSKRLNPVVTPRRAAADKRADEVRRKQGSQRLGLDTSRWARVIVLGCTVAHGCVRKHRCECKYSSFQELRRQPEQPRHYSDEQNDREKVTASGAACATEKAAAPARKSSQHGTKAGITSGDSARRGAARTRSGHSRPNAALARRLGATARWGSWRSPTVYVTRCSGAEDDDDAWDVGVHGFRGSGSSPRVAPVATAVGALGRTPPPPAPPLPPP